MTDRKNIVSFCWGENPALVSSYCSMIDLFRREQETEFLVVTDSLVGKLAFLSRDILALTAREVCALPLHPRAPRQPEELERLAPCDRFSGFNWLTPEEYKSSGDPPGMDLHHWQALRLISGFLHLLEHRRPQAAITWNGGMIGQGALAEAAKLLGIPCYFAERGLLPDSFALDPRGVNYGSHIAGPLWRDIAAPMPSAEEQARLEEYCRMLGERGQTVVNRGRELSPEGTRAALDVPAGSRVALLPLQIERDTNILNYSPIFKSMPDIVAAVEQALACRGNVTLVVKPHPEDQVRMAELSTGRADFTRFSGDLSLHSLLKIADTIVTVNSTVGLEALTQEKTVVTLGQAIYGQKGFTFDLQSRQQLTGLLGAALDAQPDPERRREFLRFLHFLLSRSLFSLAPEDPFGSRRTIIRDIFSGANDSGPVVPNAALDGLIAAAEQFRRDWRSAAPVRIVWVGAPAPTTVELPPGREIVGVDSVGNFIRSLGSAIEAPTVKHLWIGQPLRPRQRLAAKLLGLAARRSRPSLPR